MYSNFVRDAIESAKNYYEYAAKNKTSRIDVNIRQISQVSKDVYVLFLAQKLNRPDAVCLCIKSHLIEPGWYAEKNEAFINSNLYEIVKVDTDAPALYVKIKAPLSYVFHKLDRSELSLVSDLKFLIKNVAEWYKEFGHCLNFPPAPNIKSEEIYYRGDRLKGAKGKESREQKEAVQTALSNSISYIWGAPGTGKTQYVLADCLLTYVKKGQRVVVLAPTHNAIEQTLSAVIKTMEAQGENIECIYRLGIPTARFGAQYPNLCDRIDRAATIELLQKEIEELNIKIYEEQEAERIVKNHASFVSIVKKVDELSAEDSKVTQTLLIYQNDLDEKKAELRKIRDEIRDIENSLRIIRNRENALSFKIKMIFTMKEALTLEDRKDRYNGSLDIGKSKEALSLNEIQSLEILIAECSQKRHALRKKINDATNNATYVFSQTFGDFFFTSLEDAASHFAEAAEEAKSKPKHPHLREDLRLKEDELGSLSESNEQIMKNKQIFAFTVDYFFAHYKTLTEQNLGIISHVFLDEAAYCPLIKSGILYSLDAPVTLLGDHMQLSPICEAGDSATDRIESKIFMWEQSAIYLPQIFDENSSLEELFKRFYLVKHAKDITQVKYYSEESMKTATLPQTHRFGSSLASILDKFVYQNGFNGKASLSTSVYVLHGKHLPRENGTRTSYGEAEAIKQYLLQLRPTDCVVMTPYKKQRDLLQKHLNGVISPDNVLTIHASQGREWETVIVSVVDAHDRSIYFTDSTIPQGLHTLNTAISRVKSNLVIVCDTEYWKKQGNLQLIGALVTSPETKRAPLPFVEMIKLNWSTAMKDFYKQGIDEGKLQLALDQKETIESRFISNIQINRATPPYASVSIASKSGRSTYKTTIASCTCKNFIGEFPCKHIFTLALKLNLVNQDGSLNTSFGVPTENVDYIS